MPKDPSENAGCLFALFNLFNGSQGNGEEPLPYRLRDDFLTAPEASLYHVLLSVLKGRAAICPKVGLSDLFFVGKSEKWRSYMNRINAKHVDFVLCEPKTMAPLAGVELDDSSHSRPDREARDDFVDKVFEAAGLPLVRIKAQRQYNAQNLSDILLPVLGQSSGEAPHPPTPPSHPDAKAAPACPKCGVPMVLRIAQRGTNRLNSFYGCPNYPRCRETKPTA